jgi:hypothetical protein
MKKSGALVFFAFCICASVRSDGFYGDIAFSLNTANYGTSIDRLIDTYIDSLGFSRRTAGGSVSLGYGLTPGLFCTGSFLLVSDAISGFGNRMHFSSRFAFFGLRWYPLDSHKYLQLGLEAGPEWLVFKTDIDGVQDRSLRGAAINSMIGLDLASTLNGPSLLFSGNIMYAYINGGAEISAGLLLKVAFKRTKWAERYNETEMGYAAGIVIPVLVAFGTWLGYTRIPSHGER